MSLLSNRDEESNNNEIIQGDIPIYKVEKAQFRTDSDEYETRYIITRDDIPDYLVNDFLLEKSRRNISTSKSYAYSLVKLLNFLAKKNIHYLDCTAYMAKQYVNSLALGEMEDLRIKDTKNRVTYSTLQTDVTVLNEFFKFLYHEQQELKLDIKFNKKANKRSYMYGQIYEFNYMEKIVSGHAKNLKPSREYIKWYEDEQIGAILSNFNTIRDEVVFLLTLEGMRIDEVLSIKLDGVDEEEKTVQPSRSKGKQDSEEYESNKNEIRIISIPEKSFERLIAYLYGERQDAEAESGIYDDYLFINLNRGNNQGKPLSYYNYLKILKRTAQRAGLDSRKIRTHSGRSTKVNQLQEHQVLYPEDNITDAMIKEMLGWKSIQTIDAYKNKGNKVILKSASEKVYRRKKEPKDIQEEFKIKNKTGEI
ncbi:MAG: site-specific integrase [Clostridium sp.]|nr:site-specific integrase [Clostridium sp.]